MNSYMIKGILFDKDGTLIDFQSLWLRAAEEVVPLLLRVNAWDTSPGMCDIILHAMGIQGKEVLPDGPLAWMTYPEIGREICIAVRKMGYQAEEELVGRQLSVLFESVTTWDSFTYQQIVPLKPLFGRLHAQGFKIGLATADTDTAVKRCFRKLDLLDAFDFLGWDDGVMKPKPSGDMLERFCVKFHFAPEEVAVVGDTWNDMLFAKRYGAKSIGVLSGLASREVLAPDADAIINTIKELPALLEEREV